MYNGLGGYSREKQDKSARRPGESDVAWARRLNTFHRSAIEVDGEAEAQAWAEHRAAVDSRIGSGSGLFGNLSATGRAQAAGTRGFGSGREIAKEGHLAVTAAPGQVAITRIYADQIGEGEPATSPLLAHLRSSSQQ